MFPQRGILFLTDNMEYLMYHMVDSIKLTWEPADEQNSGFILAILFCFFFSSSTMSIDFIPSMSQLRHVSTEKEKPTSKVVLFVKGFQQGWMSFKLHS